MEATQAFGRCKVFYDACLLGFLWVVFVIRRLVPFRYTRAQGKRRITQLSEIVPRKPTGRFDSNVPRLLKNRTAGRRWRRVSRQQQQESIQYDVFKKIYYGLSCCLLRGSLNVKRNTPMRLHFGRVLFCLYEMILLAVTKERDEFLLFKSEIITPTPYVDECMYWPSPM